MSDVKKYLLWSGFGGLALGISVLNGVDITREGIVNVIAEEVLPFIISLIFNLVLFISGLYSSYMELKSFSEEDPEVVVLGIACFIMFFAFYFGTGLNVTWIQNVGVLAFLVLIGDLIYIKHSS